jgi:hypothetical protein
MEALTRNLWPQRKQLLTSSGLNMSNIKQTTSIALVTTILRTLFWTGIAVLNVLVLGDLFVNNGKGLIELFLLLTGGNRY